MNETAPPRRSLPNDTLWGMSDADCAAAPVVYRPDLLVGQRILLSGGGTGMGRAMAFLFARLGARVTICGRRAEKLEETAEAVKTLVGAEIRWTAMSIRDPDAVDNLLDDVFEHDGGLDILVNNAGGQFPQGAIDFSRKGWNAVVDLNLNGTWWMMQGAARRWRDRGAAGAIVNIVAHVERGMPQAAHTCAARAGVIYLSRTVATEWAPLNIRVNCVAPGAVATEGFNVYPPEATARFANANPMRRLGDAWDIAEGVVYLAAPSGKFITGELLTIDGGMRMWGNVWPGGVPEHFDVV